MIVRPRVGLSWLLVLIAAVAAPPLVAQQRMLVAGRVVRPQGADTTPVEGVRLVLHRVGRNAQGPVDSTSTDGRGRFRFRYPADTTFLYLISARFAGIEYFSSPLNTNPTMPDTAMLIAVSDTSSTQPVALAARYLVVRSPAEDGSRGVLDLVILNNRGNRTRVSPDSVTPSWAGPLPRGASGARVGEADLSADAIDIRNDSILVFAPIAPGEKQIALEYAVRPGAQLELRFDQDSVATNLLTQEGNVGVDGGELVPVDSQAIEGRWFHRWVGAPHPGDVVRVSFGRPAGGTPAWVLPSLVVLIGAGLLVSFFLLRVKPQRVTLEILTDQIAALEAKYEGREAEVPPEEWGQYQAERARLRAQLSSHLAGRGSAV